MELGVYSFGDVQRDPRTGALGSTAEAQENIGQFVAGKLLDYTENGSTELSVNFPEVTLTRVSTGVRLLHIHENVPGVLSAVNSVFSQHQVNVDRQALVTQGETGYLVTDCSSGVTREVIDEILGLEATKRLATIQAD